MFLVDQQKAIKTQNSEIKLLDLAANAIKEWDLVVTIRDEYTAKSLDESQKYESALFSNNIQPTILSQAPTQGIFNSGGANTKPSPPNKPPSAYDCYKQDCIEQMKSQYPGKCMIEIGVMILQMWETAHPDIKLHYETKAKEAEARYRREIADYEARFGRVIEIMPQDIALARRIRNERW